MTWDSGIRFDLRILRFFQGPGVWIRVGDVSPRAESHFSAVWIRTTSRFLQIKVFFWNPRSLKKVLTIVLILVVTIASWVSRDSPRYRLLAFFTIIMEVENGPLEINLLFQRPLFYCYGRVHPGKINSLLLKIGLSKRKGLSSNPHFSEVNSLLNCGDAVYIPRITTD